MSFGSRTPDRLLRLLILSETLLLSSGAGFLLIPRPRVRSMQPRRETARIQRDWCRFSSYLRLLFSCGFFSPCAVVALDGLLASCLSTVLLSHMLLSHFLTLEAVFRPWNRFEPLRFDFIAALDAFAEGSLPNAFESLS